MQHARNAKTMARSMQIPVWKPQMRVCSSLGIAVPTVTASMSLRSMTRVAPNKPVVTRPKQTRVWKTQTVGTHCTRVGPVLPLQALVLVRAQMCTPIVWEMPTKQVATNVPNVNGVPTDFIAAMIVVRSLK